jgi:hypothetical protein
MWFHIILEEVGGYTPHSCINLKTKGMQNGFPQVHEKKGRIFS